MKSLLIAMAAMAACLLAIFACVAIGTISQASPAILDTSLDVCLPPSATATPKIPKLPAPAEKATNPLLKELSAAGDLESQVALASWRQPASACANGNCPNGRCPSAQIYRTPAVVPQSSQPAAPQACQAASDGETRELRRPLRTAAKACAAGGKRLLARIFRRRS